MTQIGDMVRLHNADTKISKDPRKAQEVRWCMVIGISGSSVRVAPRSTTVKGPVFTSEKLMPEFSRDGWFKRWSVSVPKRIVDNAQNIGQLPEPARTDVLNLFTRRSTP